MSVSIQKLNIHDESHCRNFGDKHLECYVVTFVACACLHTVLL
jgi:hypothetical protein